MFMNDLDYENKSSKIYGVVTAIVTNNKDDEGMGRVKVNYPWLAEDDESYWARIATLMAGDGRGTYFIPEIDDEVLVAFEHGDIHYPYIIGALWNGQDKVHENNDDGENNLRVIKSRCGHKVIFDDTDGNEKITIIDYTEDRKIVIDSKEKTIDIRNENGKINIFAGDDINIETNKNLNITVGENMVTQIGSDMDTTVGNNMATKVSKKIDITAGSSFALNAGSTSEFKTGSGMQLTAGTSTAIKAGTQMTVSSGGTSSIEAGATMTINGAMTTVKASGITTIKGSLVKLN